ncbi:MAG TPA: FAD-dependent oxidoreductase, partial [Candidatus Kapabacteria bacterium]|nr:FAD-dependent oxidoreductase [Candidatus Kapabacteria bacterium]
GSINLDIKGSDAKGVTTAMEFLRTYNLRGSVPVGKNVVIVGGGNAAFDAARSAIRLGAEKVSVIYRRSQDEMPAYVEEIDEALQEGITLMPLTNPEEILTENGKVVGMKCTPMKLGDFDRSGRRRPIKEDRTFVVECDQVILAVGQAIENPEIFEKIKLKMNNNENIIVDPVTQQTSIPWLFAGGDVAVVGNSDRTVIEAIAAGERAAVGIDTYITGEFNAFWREEKPNDTLFDPDADPAPYPRVKMPLLSVDRRRNNFNEVEQSYTEAEAIRQAKRCLRCDYGH